jgi:hypothetical protein
MTFEDMYFAIYIGHSIEISSNRLNCTVDADLVFRVLPRLMHALFL